MASNSTDAERDERGSANGSRDSGHAQRATRGQGDAPTGASDARSDAPRQRGG
jgi:hypothetical protein